jgi:hypothetical protein
MSTEHVGDVAVEVTPEPEETSIEVLRFEEGTVRARIRSGAMNAVVFLEPETAKELGGDLIDMAEEVGE